MSVIVINFRSQFYMMTGIIVSDSEETAKVKFLNEPEPLFFFKAELAYFSTHN